MSDIESPTNPESELTHEKPENICPYLGLKQDPATFYLFQSDSNYCHRSAIPTSITLEYQGQFCLHEGYVNCPIFKEGWDGRVPDRLKQETHLKRTQRSRRKWIRILTLLAAAFLCLGVVGTIAFVDRAQPGQARSFLDNFLFLIGNGGLEPASRPTKTGTPAPAGTLPPRPTSTSTLTSTPTFTPFLDNTATEAVVFTSTPSVTEFPTPGPGLGTPFGPENQFLIHVVIAGESYTSIGQVYSTSPDVLRAVNPTLEGVSLWIGRQIVVPIGVQEVGDLPAFEITYTQEAINIMSLADFYGTNPEKIRFYNQLGDSDEIPSGRWLIIPLSS